MVLKNLQKWAKSSSKLVKMIVPTSSSTEFYYSEIYRAARLLKGYQRLTASNGKDLTQEDVDNFTTEVDQMNYNALHSYIHSNITDQLVPMFSKLEPEEDESTKKFNAIPFLGSITNNNTKTSVEFQLEVKKSSLPNAGNGLFLKSEASIYPGTAVCLYPGLVHLSELLKDRDHLNSLLPDDDFMLFVRTDNSLIDARSRDQVPKNPYAFGHMINHCGNDKKPNVVQVSYDFKIDLRSWRSFPQELRKHIPNRYVKPLAFFSMLENHSIIMQSAVFLSSRYINPGDELLMDYRLNPTSKFPSWYTPFDVEESKLRWNIEEPSIEDPTEYSKEDSKPQ